MPAVEFVPARPSSLVRGSCQFVMPLLLSQRGVVGVDYDADDLDRLRSLEGHRLLLTPNHPTNTEPLLMFHLSCIVRQPFFYMATRDAFDTFWGLGGRIMSALGAFSVMRGAVDRASYRAARELLTTPKAKLVVFPEGEVYSQNDTLLPFHNGIFQLAFWAQEDVVKAGRDEPLYILPVALKYYYIEEMGTQIEASLRRLADFTGADVGPGDDTYTRLRKIGSAMLLSLEREYRLTPDNQDLDDLTTRLDAVKEAILIRVASAAGVALPKGETLPERMRNLIHVIETVSRDEPIAKTPYDTELRRQQRERARPLLHDLRRLSNWIAVYDGYVRANPTPERLADTLIRLERECFGEERLQGRRKCRVRLGAPLDIRERWPGYERSRRAEVIRTTRETESRVAALLGAAPVPEGLFA
ncbi:MAG: lysophospholipid acyltransferase family protein [Capsulimonadales bacterium]|nr:lysophospholipid acyltransferase family protein [Capsulimonadales bacterium]